MADIVRIRRIYNKFDPHRLPSDSEYVDLEAARSESVLNPLLNSLLFADSNQPIARLFGGGRGAGKTTELRRFEQRLRASTFFALYLDVESTVDVNNCDFADFLLAIASNLRTALESEKLAGFSPLRQYIDRKVEEVIKFFTQSVRVPGGSLEYGNDSAKASVDVAFERKPSHRQMLEDEFEALAADSVLIIRDLIKKIQEYFIEHGYAGLVLLVDGGDKIVPYRAGHDTVSQHTKIFAQRATQLCDLACHVVYSVPLSFCYSPDAQHFNATAGAQPIVLPMTSLRGQDKSSATSATKGYQLFHDIVDRRLASVQESVQTVFETDAIEQIILMSGGNPTSLMTIIQESFIRGDNTLPIRLGTVKEAIRSMANALNRAIPSDFWPLLKNLAKPAQRIDKSDIFLSSLYYQFIYEYMNGGSWFEVNPVLKTLDQLSS